MRENRPSGSEGGVALIPPSLPLSCAAATLHGASERAKRLECARLLALSKSPTAPRDLPGHCRLPQTTGWIAHPTTLPSDGRLAPGRGPGEPAQAASTRRQRSSACRAPCAPAGEVAGGEQNPKSAPESVASPQEGGIRFLNNPSHSRDLCRSEPRER
jgi:hypothetical protein